MFIQYWESFLRPYQGAGAISASGNGSDVIQDGGRKRKLHLHLDGVSKGLSILLKRSRLPTCLCWLARTSCAQTVELSVGWCTMTLMWCYYNNNAAKRNYSNCRLTHQFWQSLDIYENNPKWLYQPFVPFVPFVLRSNKTMFLLF